MQIQRFSNGGYVAHKIYVDGMTSKFSAWFSAKGDLLDVDRIDSQCRSYPVRVGSKAWKDIAAFGRWWKAAAS